MSRDLPWDLDANVSIEPYDVLEYVKENKDWFLAKLNISSQTDVASKLDILVDSIVDKYNKVRLMRDKTHSQDENLTVCIYNDLLEIQKIIKTISIP